MKITWTVLVETAQDAGLEIKNVGARLYNVRDAKHNLKFIGTARECYAYMRGWQRREL